MKLMHPRALLAAASLLVAGAAHAGGVQWSIGISLPPIAFVGSSGPIVAPVAVVPPVSVAPVPVPVYAVPAPIVYAPPPVVVVPRRVVRPVPIVLQGWAPPGREWRRHHGPRRGHWHDYD